MSCSPTFLKGLLSLRSSSKGYRGTPRGRVNVQRGRGPEKGVERTESGFGWIQNPPSPISLLSTSHFTSHFPTYCYGLWLPPCITSKEKELHGNALYFWSDRRVNGVGNDIPVKVRFPTLKDP